MGIVQSFLQRVARGGEVEQLARGFQLLRFHGRLELAVLCPLRRQRALHRVEPQRLHAGDDGHGSQQRGEQPARDEGEPAQTRPHWRHHSAHMAQAIGLTAQPPELVAQPPELLRAG